jgi:hypothetical protein
MFIVFALILIFLNQSATTTLPDDRGSFVRPDTLPSC